MLQSIEVANQISIYAAVIASLSLVISLVLAVKEFLKGRREVSIYVADDWVKGRRHGYPRVVVVNIGYRPVTIIGTGFINTNGEQLPAKYPPQDIELPRTLNLAEALEWSFDSNDVAIQSDWKVFVTNAKGKTTTTHFPESIKKRLLEREQK